MVRHMKYLKILVIVMGALIVLGVGCVIFLIFRQGDSAQHSMCVQIPSGENPKALSVSDGEISLLTNTHILIFSRKSGKLQQKISLSHITLDDKLPEH